MTKTITVRYFASIREAMGTGEETWATTAPTVAALRQELAGRSAQAALALAEDQPVRLALNQAMCPPDAPIAPGDEVAFFPPVTGG
ncbi:MAG: molybdopterin converting factor subunit 1 [Comamonas sp.]|jgi:molybdopterin synthase sulfur carrier subunit|nr:molybdopterin converting factor subunit 1 [Comamonas sp.]HRL38749.1 molybdopterin converting factor subunit 1 [Comamonas denitrificans]HRL90228.1 molybdopterin converting factor subunit 1 [Comamonas denitrificans]HRL97397.1 molybdopterin converting factor subunit 1 [Comamonas denitrificans]HRM65566.1 molybdopterin converting factor subunit 1 [Comamonas denitrificans]